MFLHRLFNRKINPYIRAIQLANAGIEAMLARPYNLLHVVEYPKCGGSWVRNMLRTYRETTLFTHDRLIKPNDVIMTHCLYRSRFARTIVVVRDPRDLYVSFYHYENSYEKSDQNSVLYRTYTHDKTRPVYEDFYAYLETRLLTNSHPWFFYSQFLDAWLNSPNVCVVRYEDCLNEPETQLIRMLRYAGDTIDLDRVSHTVTETNFKAITQKKYGMARNSGEQDNSKFHRKGTAGDWRNHFNEASCQLLEKMEGSSLRMLGYEKDSAWVDNFASEMKSGQTINKVASV